MFTNFLIEIAILIGQLAFVPADSIGLRPVYRLYAQEDTSEIERWNAIERNPLEIIYMKSDSGIMVWGIKKFGIAIGQSVEFRQSMEVRIKGQLNDSTEVSGHIVDSDLSTTAVVAQEPSEFDRIYIKTSSPRFTVQIGDIAPFGIDPSLRVQGVYGKVNLRRYGLEISSAYGTSRSIVHTMGFSGKSGFQGPYELKGKFGEKVQVIPGSEHVSLNGRTMERGFDKDYVIDYDAATITFTPKRTIHEGDTIVVRFAYRQFEFDKILRGIELSHNGLDIRVIDRWDDVSHINDAERRKLAQLGDSAGLVSGGTYVGEGKGDYVWQGDHFEFVGAGNGDYVVEFQYVGENKGDYVYDPLSMNFRFVGNGNGDFIAAKRVEPPEWNRFVGLEFEGRWLKLKVKSVFKDRNILADGEMHRGIDGEARMHWDEIDFGNGTLKIGLSLGGYDGLDQLDGITPFKPNRWLDADAVWNFERWSLGVSGHSERRTQGYWMDWSKAILTRHISKSISISTEIMAENASTHRFKLIGLNALMHKRFLTLSLSTKAYFGDSTSKEVALSALGRRFQANVIHKNRDGKSELMADVNFSVSAFGLDMSFSGNYFKSDSAERKSFLASWTSRYGFWGGLTLTNGIEKQRLVRYKLVGEGRGNYSYDPLTGRYYPDDGGSYVKEVIYVPSGREIQRKSVNLGMNRPLSKKVELTLFGSFEDEGDQNRLRSNIGMSWHVSDKSTLRFNNSLFREDGNWEMSLRRSNSEVVLEHDHWFVGLRSEFSRTISHLTSYRDAKTIFSGRRSRFGSLSLSFKKINAASPPLYESILLDVWSFEPTVSLKIKEISVSLNGEVHYGILKNFVEEPQRLSRILPIGWGYRYSLNLQRKVGRKSILKLKLSGDRFKTRFNADVELRF
ncbi:MAG: hypothetical protein DRQ10_06290 [Candidatus Hydrothermota bacterium]|nr:MAG: hypothetical protein DRQ10_06290 [Candidatus Hydrothermae bacterium]